MVEAVGEVGVSWGGHMAKEGSGDWDIRSCRQRFAGSPGRSGGRVRYNLRNPQQRGDELSRELACVLGVMV